MVSYLNRLECLIEKWQSRRKTIEISQAIKSAELRQTPQACDDNNPSKSNSINSPPYAIQTYSKREAQEPSIVTSGLAQAPVAASMLPVEDSRHNSEREASSDNNNNSNHKLKPPSIMTIMKQHNRPQSPPIYVLSILLLPLLSTAVVQPLAGETSKESPSAQVSKQRQQRDYLELDRPSGRQLGLQLGLDLIQQLAAAGGSGGSLFSASRLGAPSTRNRWIQVPGPQQSIRDPPNRRYRTHLGRMFSRLRNQIGARNTIRVHNAFRDFAWRLLSSLSMPTPVIYELRRQHLYSPEDDLMNDSFFNKNTTRTIRSKRQLLKFWPAIERRRLHRLRRASDDNDDDNEDRFSLRLAERLFGSRKRGRAGIGARMLRVFPFKRQEETTDESNKTTGRGFGRRRRRRKDSESRQMISINGKQYYVNDEGELKELKGSKSDQ